MKHSAFVLGLVLVLVTLSGAAAMAGTAGSVVLPPGQVTVVEKIQPGMGDAPSWYVVRVSLGGPACCTTDPFLTPHLDALGNCDTALRFSQYDAPVILPGSVVNSGMECVANVWTVLQGETGFTQ